MKLLGLLLSFLLSSFSFSDAPAQDKVEASPDPTQEVMREAKVDASVEEKNEEKTTEVDTKKEIPTTESDAKKEASTAEKKEDSVNKTADAKKEKVSDSKPKASSDQVKESETKSSNDANKDKATDKKEEPKKNTEATESDGQVVRVRLDSEAEKKELASLSDADKEMFERLNLKQSSFKKDSRKKDKDGKITSGLFGSTLSSQAMDQALKELDDSFDGIATIGLDTENKVVRLLPIGGFKTMISYQSKAEDAKDVEKETWRLLSDMLLSADKSYNSFFTDYKYEVVHPKDPSKCLMVIQNGKVDYDASLKLIN